MGIIGLSNGLDYITSRGLGAIHDQEMVLIRKLASGLKDLANVEIYCGDSFEAHTAVLTVNVKGMHPSDVGAVLDGDFEIAVRTGLHCAPLVHETLGSFPKGAVRFSPGPFNTEDDIDKAVAAMTAISRSRPIR
jgi:selenocysteine lyase/cysteine desulfurase